MHRTDREDTNVGDLSSSLILTAFVFASERRKLERLRRRVPSQRERERDFNVYRDFLHVRATTHTRARAFSQSAVGTHRFSKMTRIFMCERILLRLCAKTLFDISCKHLCKTWQTDFLGRRAKLTAFRSSLDLPDRAAHHFISNLISQVSSQSGKIKREREREKMRE